tara:strand:- start:301 stop:426 length:126 start_codon:yes stop_codon:yes gene_type:complete
MGNSKSLINSFGCNCFEDPDDEASERMDGYVLMYYTSFDVI